MPGSSKGPLSWLRRSQSNIPAVYYSDNKGWNRVLGESSVWLWDGVVNHRISPYIRKRDAKAAADRLADRLNVEFVGEL